MDEITIRMGKNIRELRERQKITQKELSKNICTQAMLSNIESGKSSPTIVLLYPLCERLNVDVSQLITISLTERSDYIDEVKKQLKKTAIDRNYIEMKQIIRYEKKNPLSQLIDVKRVLLWYEAIYLFYTDDKPEICFSLLNEALVNGKNSKGYSSIEIEILLTRANFLTDLEKYSEAILAYEEIINHIENIPTLLDNQIYIKYYYNYSRVLRLNGEITSSIKYCKKGINFCVSCQSMYLLGDLYFQLGKNFDSLNQHNKSKESLSTALYFYRIINNIELIVMTQRELKKTDC